MARPAKWGEAQAWAREAAQYNGDDCLIWPFKAKMTSGYGSIKAANPRRQVGAHRFICELAKGPPPESRMECAHGCGVKMCCNPKHLRWATHRENDADKDAHGTRNIGIRNGSAKLTVEQVLRIRRLRAEGTSVHALAREHEMSPSSISLIANRINWSWL